MLIKKYQIQVVQRLQLFCTNISEVKNKISNSDKYITTPKFNKLTAENVRTRLKQGNLVNKTDFGNKLISFNRSIISNKTKYIKIKKKLNKGKQSNNKR